MKILLAQPLKPPSLQPLKQRHQDQSTFYVFCAFQQCICDPTDTICFSFRPQPAADCWLVSLCLYILTSLSYMFKIQKLQLHPFREVSSSSLFYSSYHRHWNSQLLSVAFCTLRRTCNRKQVKGKGERERQCQLLWEGSFKRSTLGCVCLLVCVWWGWGGHGGNKHWNRKPGEINYLDRLR